jgi:acyl-CoA thioester hydrolase
MFRAIMNPAQVIKTDAEEAIFTWPVRVYYEDTDAAGVVYFANYLKFMERARTEWLRQHGSDHNELAEKNKIAFAVRSLKAEYLKPARLNENLDVKTQIKGIRKASLDFIQTIVRGNDILVTAETLVACVDTIAFKPVAIPQQLLSRIEQGL